MRIKSKMKTLVVYYSKTGNTRKVGKLLAKKLKSDIDEIIDKTDRKGIKGWLFGGRDAMQKNITEVKFSKNPKKYDLAVIGTPVWAFTVSPAVRTYLLKNKFKKVAFFLTYDSTGAERAFSEMQKCSKNPIATLALTKNELSSDNLFIKKVDDFCRKIR